MLCVFWASPFTLWFIFNIFIHKWEKLNLQFSLVLMIHNAFQALNFDISKIKRVLDTRIFTKIKVLIEQKWPFCHFSLFLYSKKRQKFAHWIHLCKFVQKLIVHPQLSKGYKGSSEESRFPPHPSLSIFWK